MAETKFTKEAIRCQELRDLTSKPVLLSCLDYAPSHYYISGRPTIRFSLDASDEQVLQIIGDA